MNLSINPRNYIKAAIWEEERSLLEAIGLVAKAGFTHLDLEACTEQEADEIAAYTKENGLTIIQSHLPFNRYKREPAEVFHQKLMDYAKNAKRMDSKILVAHADEFDYRNEVYTTKAALEHNYRVFYDIVDFAAANGMRVAFENTFQEPTMTVKPHFCALTDDLLALVDRYGTDTVGICWDTGHARVQYGTHDMDALKVVGEKVICTHVHDNYYDTDLHSYPFTGNINWKALMETLREIQYKGDFSLEFVYDHLPNALAPDYLKLIYRTAEYMIHSL